MKKYKKNTSSFLFYDYETFGTNTALDKPAQFACIRTDINFNIIDDAQCFYCIPSDDYFPDPSSVLITHITPQYTKKHGMNECDFSKRIYNILKKPNTCIVGFNNINFDDEITRNIFYRNFLDPYEWSWKNGNSRWDLLYLLRACYALRPNGIKWPKNNMGLPSFKLSELTEKNDIVHINAHDAIADVYATIEVAKLVKINQPKLFDFFFKYRNKNQLYKLIDLNAYQPLVYVSNIFSALRSNVSYVLPIIWHKHNKNILISIDLFKNLQELIYLCKNISFDQSFIKSLFTCGIVFLYLNRCPMLAPIAAIRQKDFNRLKFDSDLYQSNINLLKQNKNIIKNIQIIFSKENDFNQSEDVDLQIYTSFFSIHDKKIIHKIRNSKPKYWENIIYDFEDTRLKELFFRYRARNFFNTLNNNEKQLWFNHCFCILNPNSLKEYQYKIQCLLQEHAIDNKKVSLLNDLLKYMTDKYKKLLENSITLN